MVRDFEETVKTLVTSGTDLMLEDQYSRTSFHIYAGPTSSFDWLVRDGEWDLRTAMQEDLLSMIWSLATSLATNLPELVRQFTMGKSLQALAQISVHGLCVFHIIIWAWELAVKQQLSLSPGLGSLIIDLIRAGADLHNVINIPYTSLLYLLDLVDKPANLNFLIKEWLTLLNHAGVDLVEYGRTENKMHKNHETSWTLWHDIESTSGHENKCRFKLVSLWIGETPEDFCIEFEDLYVSAGLAARFWEWVEAPSVEERMKEMPGSWQGD
ncbi:hypothetical protein IFR05_014094 [Cadophora sp. M221]|nr:hypothetical protein IFR05_014094 [Cadophora sp. M221]